MAQNYCGGVVPDDRADGPLRAAAGDAFDGLEAGLGRLDYSGGYGAVWDLLRATNAFIEERQPWALHKAGDAAAVGAVLGDCLEVLRVVAVLTYPLMPNTAVELWSRLGLPGSPAEQRLPGAATWGQLPAGNRLVKGPALFPRKEVA
jgi:methionyl-tRNA synthetase